MSDLLVLAAGFAGILVLVAAAGMGGVFIMMVGSGLITALWRRFRG